MKGYTVVNLFKKKLGINLIQLVVFIPLALMASESTAH